MQATAGPTCSNAAETSREYGSSVSLSAVFANPMAETCGRISSEPTRSNDRALPGHLPDTVPLLNFRPLLLSNDQENPMNMHTDTLALYSDALVARAEAATAHVIAVRLREGRHVSGLIWQADLVVTSEQALPRRDTFDLVLPGGTGVTAT